MGEVRSFLAIPLTESLIVEVRRIGEELADLLPGIRWVRSESIHLTLRFFGDIPEESLDRIGEIMLSVGHSHPPFEVEISGVGAFPSLTRPRVIWLGIREEPLLKNLHVLLERELETIGFPPEDRPFSPHLTLGRRRQRSTALRVPENFRNRACGSLLIDRLVLFESRLERGGAIHLARKVVHLDGSPPEDPSSETANRN